ncbi:hypothetical protein QBC34DRAFT_442505 [Podospora aff. communis PSN243]|uniref:DRBM domain-containing protein n=1 Tax=Podospora aff. communis PSN243 TaxID=3040156 RepID=A0AAV9G8C7_9PEZI|nr:hypothetical protein QBC34DRAFT_442505 [Podospora aff. communis PSN243]
MAGFYMQYLESLCRRRGWQDPSYECYRDSNGYTATVLVNGREYETDDAFESSGLAQENIAMRAFMVARNFSINGGLRASTGANVSRHSRRTRRGSRHTASSSSSTHSSSSRAMSDRHVWHNRGHDGSSSRSSCFDAESVASVSSAASSLMSKPPALIPPTTQRLKSVRLTAFENFKAAISHQDRESVHSLVEDCLEEIAVEEYAWLKELRLLGYSVSEIAEELLERSRDGPWIFSRFDEPIVGTADSGFHLPGCLHNDKTIKEVSGSRPHNGSNEGSPCAETTGKESYIRESIQFLCGIGGVGPLPGAQDGIRYGSVVFENDNSTAIASLAGPSCTVSSALCSVLRSLEKAAAVLQRVGGCCNSFTFLLRRRPSLQVELMRVYLDQIPNTQGIDRLPPSLGGRRLLGSFFPEVEGLSDNLVADASLDALAAQFLSLAFLSYSEGHCGPVRYFFLDTFPERILLIGDGVWGPNFDGPCILCSLAELSCFGDMLQHPVLAFQFFKSADRARAVHGAIQRLDLQANAIDLLDTWGPGECITPKDNTDRLFAISIGGGLILPAPITALPTPGEDNNATPLLHWSRPERNTLSTLTSGRTFSRTVKPTIGARIAANHECEADPQSQLRAACSLLEELGTFPSYWEVAERHLGLGLQVGGGGVALLQFNQTWVKRQGLTKKAKMLAQRALFITDLEATFGVQISVCTGIARRVRLRVLLADVLPAYVGALVTKPGHWNRLVEDCGLLEALRQGNLSDWLGKLETDLQRAFESLAVSVLFLLQDTGVDRKGQNLVVGCIQPDMPFQCFRLPCRKENYWARMIADSEDVATFAYMTTDCLETDVVRCRGSGGSWANSTALFWTAVSCCQEDVPEVEKTLPPVPWTLKHSEAYLIGQADAPLLVQVDRKKDNEEPQLLVSVSTIRPDILRRLTRKGKPGRKPRRLREMRPLDRISESVIVLVGERG